MNMDDICPPQKADAIWLLDLSRRRQLFDQMIRSVGRSTKLVLQTVESPLITPPSHKRSIQRQCDFVLTYGSHRTHDPRYHHYHLPSYLEVEEGGIPFSERRRCHYG